MIIKLNTSTSKTFKTSNNELLKLNPSFVFESETILSSTERFNFNSTNNDFSYVPYGVVLAGVSHDSTERYSTVLDNIRTEYSYLDRRSMLNKKENMCHYYQNLIDTQFAGGFYKAAANVSINTSSTAGCFIESPLAAFNTANTNAEAYLICRGIPILMKNSEISTSKRIYQYPQYLFENTISGCNAKKENYNSIEGVYITKTASTSATTASSNFGTSTSRRNSYGDAVLSPLNCIN